MGDVVRIKEETPPEKVTSIDQATEILAFLNKKTGKRFAARNPVGSPTANANIIMHRLKEGYTIADLKAVIAIKCREWVHDEKMSRYLTPLTLFGRQKFDSYMGEIGGEDS